MAFTGKPICDYCNQPLDKEKIWTLDAYRYKCCSAKHLLLIHCNPRIVTWGLWKQENSGLIDDTE